MSSCHLPSLYPCCLPSRCSDILMLPPALPLTPLISHHCTFTSSHSVPVHPCFPILVASNSCTCIISHFCSPIISHFFIQSLFLPHLPRRILITSHLGPAWPPISASPLLLSVRPSCFPIFVPPYHFPSSSPSFLFLFAFLLLRLSLIFDASPLSSSSSQERPLQPAPPLPSSLFLGMVLSGPVCLSQASPQAFSHPVSLFHLPTRH